MAQILILYNKENKDLAGFFLHAFAATKVTPILQKLEDKVFSRQLQSQLEQIIISSNAVFILLDTDIEQSEIMKNNLVWTCAAASKKDIWVFEPAECFHNIKLILPGFQHYARLENADNWSLYIQAAINFYDDSNFLPALAAGSGLGALVAEKDKVAGGIIGLLSGLTLAAINQAQRQPMGEERTCIKCSHFFRVHLAHETKDFRCVSCGAFYLERNGLLAQRIIEKNALKRQNNNKKTSLPNRRKIFNTAMTKTTETPKAFISYSWDNKEHLNWVRDLAMRLRTDGIDVMLDQWHVIPGDQLPEFMERAVRENDFVIIVCTPNYKQKSDKRTGGVGYEGNVMTGELAARMNHRKFIPILRHSDWQDAAPSWLLGKLYINLNDDSFEEGYENLLNTLHNQRTGPPPLGKRPESKKPTASPNLKSSDKKAKSAKSDKVEAKERVDSEPNEPIKIKRIIEEKVTKPRMDGTRGSGLYAIPFQLSRQPSSIWSQLFVENWNHPPSFTTMHRSGIARVAGDTVILDGTTIGEVEKYHRETLLLVIERTNQQYAAYEEQQRQVKEAKRRQEDEHTNRIRDSIGKIKFD